MGENSALIFQITLFLRGWFVVGFVIFEYCMLFIKSKSLPFPSPNFYAEFFLILMYLVIDFVGIRMGKRGNLTNKAIFIFVNILFHIPSILSLIYLVMWQTYILRIELIVVNIAIIFNGLEFIMALIAMIRVNRSITA